MAKYRLVVLEETREKARVEAAARVEEERRRRKEREKEIRDHQISLTRARALKRQEEEQAEEERIRRVRAKKNLQRIIQQKKQDEEKTLRLWKKIDEDNQKIQFKENLEFFKKYLGFYGLRLKSIENRKHDEFMKLMNEGFGYPWNKFSYSEEEMKALPNMLKDRQTIDLALSMGLWPFKKDIFPISPRNDEEIGNPNDLTILLSLFM